MTSLINKFVDTYNYIFTDLADPRVNGFFLLPSPIPIVTLICLYLYFCTSFGPRYMQNRKPYDLKNVVLVYNAFQVVMSSYLFSMGVQYMWSKEFSFACELVDYSNNPRALWVAGASWWFFFSKVIEFLDTIFFVLRKKNNQISFLHVYHHSMMAFTMWIGAKYFPGGQGCVMGTLNSFVHIVMYTYYLIAGLGPEYQKYIWWKKHVTILQLVQFVIICIHSLNGMFNGCPFPKIISFLIIFNSLLFIHLFGKFFYSSYIKDSSKNSRNETIENGTNKNGTATNETHKNRTATNEINNNGTAINGTSNGNSLIDKNVDAIKNGVHNVITNGKHKDV